MKKLEGENLIPAKKLLSIVQSRADTMRNKNYEVDKKSSKKR